MGSQTAFDVTLGAPTNLEDLGAIAADTSVDATAVTLNDSQHFFTFTLEANQVAEIRVDKSAVASLDLFGSTGSVFSGRELDGYASFSIDAPLATYFYSPTGGSYTLSVSDANFSLTDVVFSVTSTTPGASTTLALGATDQKTSATVVEDFRREYFTYELSADSLLSIDALNAGGGLTDVFVFDATTGEEVFAGDAFLDSSYEGEDTVEIPLMAGTYVVGVGAEEEDDLDAGYTLDVSALSPPSFEVEPNETTANASALDIESTYGLGEVTVGDVDVFTFQLTNAIPAGSFARMTVTPDAAFDAATTYTCRLLDSDGTTVIAEQTVSTDCSLTTTTLAAATSYFLEITTTSATAVDYRIENDLIEGALEVEPNGDSTTATDLGTYTAGTPLVAYGELTTDGTTSDTDWHTFELAAGLSGQTLVIDIDDAYGESSSSAVTLDVYASTDLVNPAATETGFGSTFEFADLAAGTYFLVLTRTDTDAITSARYRVTANAVTKISASSVVGVAIPDNDLTTGVTDTINVTDTCTIAGVEVPVDITHTWRNDLTVTLVSPAGTSVVLQSRSGGSADDLVGTFGDDLTAVGNLGSLANESATGDWTLTVTDGAGSDFGTFNGWGLEISCL